MLKTTKDQIKEETLITIAGSIDEDASIDRLLGDLSGKVTVHCMGVTRINSVGVKAWIRYFQKAMEHDVKLKFSACSVILIEQANLISNFLCGGVVESFYLPYLCENCGREHSQLILTQELQRGGLKPPTVNCPHCSQPLVFDSVPEDYFSFIKEAG